MHWLVQHLSWIPEVLLYLAFVSGVTIGGAFAFFWLVALFEVIQERRARKSGVELS